MASILRRAFLEGYATSGIDLTVMFVCIGITALMALFICFIYKMINKNSFYDRSFHLSLFSLAVITSAIILTIQSNIVVSLGMVGALSIVRYRTAIKNPMDLVFLFWSVAIGIVCGAGFAMIGIIGSIVLTIGLILFSIRKGERGSLVLVVNAEQYIEKEIERVLANTCKTWRVRARNITEGHVSLAIELKTQEPHQLVEAVNGLEHVTSVSLVEHDGDVTA